MKKNILIGLLVLSVCTSQAMDHKIKMKKVKKTEEYSLFEKYIPGAKMAKKIIFFGTLFLFFGGGQTFECKLPTLQECTNNLSVLKSNRNFGSCYGLRNGEVVRWSGACRLSSNEGPYDDPLAIRDSRLEVERWEDKVKSLKKKCIKQLRPTDKASFFRQLSPAEQSEIFNELDYEDAVKLKEALEK